MLIIDMIRKNRTTIARQTYIHTAYDADNNIKINRPEIRGQGETGRLLVLVCWC